MLTQCDYCNAKFRNKELLSNHILIHNVEDEQINKFGCIVCKMKFPNKVFLNQHMSRVHNKNQKFSKRKRTQPKKHTCVACLMKFQYVCQLKYHIRKQHFNLTGQTPYCDLKSINQVWFEKVLNTNVIVEIKKLGHNYLLIRKLNENTTIKVTDSDREVFDLRVNYPLSSDMKVLTKQGTPLFSYKEISQLRRTYTVHEHLLGHRCTHYSFTVIAQWEGNLTQLERDFEILIKL